MDYHSSYNKYETLASTTPIKAPIKFELCDMAFKHFKLKENPNNSDKYVPYPIRIIQTALGYEITYILVCSSRTLSPRFLKFKDHTNFKPVVTIQKNTYRDFHDAIEKSFIERFHTTTIMNYTNKINSKEMADYTLEEVLCGKSDGLLFIDANALHVMCSYCSKRLNNVSAETDEDYLRKSSSYTRRKEKEIYPNPKSKGVASRCSGNVKGF